MARCDYANARVGGRRARLLGARVGELLTLPTLEARLERLLSSDYAAAARAARDLDAEELKLRAVERALGDVLAREAAELATFVEGATARALFDAVVALDRAEAVKAALRGIARALPAGEVAAFAEAAPGLDEAAREELAAERDLEAAAAWLARRRDPMAAALPAWRAGAAAAGDWLHVEAAIDRATFAAAFSTARAAGRDEDAAIVARALSARVDLTNGATLLKLAGRGAAAELFLDGGALIDVKQFTTLGALAPPALADALATALRPLLGDARAAAAELSVPWRADRLFERALLRLLAREARTRPLSLAVVLAHLAARRAELRRIRVALRGAALGLPAAELVDLVEA